MTVSGMHTQPPASAALRGFVTVDGCRLHYIRQGQGPAVVMLHASPCSAKVMSDLQARWGAEFTTIAFDLPGFGLSQSPDGVITIPVLAEMIVGGMRALGIEQAALYGRHTGASVCLDIALNHPGMVSMLLTDGLPIFAAPYTEERLAQYLPPIESRWDGGHLTWAYFRYREQHMFWPWDYSVIAHRADADLPDVQFLHRGAVELLEAAETYAQTYQAAFRYETLPLVDKVEVPVFWGNRPGDSQFKTIPRYPAGAPIHVVDRDPEIALEEELALLRLHPAVGDVPQFQSGFAASSLPMRLEDYIETRHGCVRAIGIGLQHGGVPLIYLHDLPGGIDLHLEEIELLAQNRPVLAFELAGNGESYVSSAPGNALWLDQIDDVIAQLGWARVELFAHGTSAGLALDYALKHPANVAGVILRSPPILSAEERALFRTGYAPDITPSEDGGYLLRLWHHLRDQELWYPHFRRDHASRRTTPPRIDPAWLTRRAVTLLKQPEHYAPIWQAVFDQDVAAALGAVTVPVHVIVDPSDIFAGTSASHASGSTPAAISE
ncbi:MAG: alpha/beta hydrolase [Devosia sp.]|uniref:alpha/beta hydrolase n=1 Tax=unclassified Devosia TaxID=196773 RepID=UPI0019FC43E8|nr:MULTISPECIES: alpha/beta hydrolase [unclassified Devosia]MBF0678952.1 alpha/beta hydrolase [Devosia sp.]WEJ33569.1 alpha/beta hydrolase [Devosia sp. SD17-2]